VSSMLPILLTLVLTPVQGPRALELPDEVMPPRVVPEGTVIPLSLISEISTEHANEGDGVYAQTIFPITVNDEIVIPVGSYVQGRVVNAVRPGRVTGKAEMTLTFHTLVLPTGITLPIYASLGGVGGTAERTGEAGVAGDSSKGRDVETIGTTTVTGAGVGAIAGRSRGAIVGGGIGAAIGVTEVLLTRGDDLILRPGTTIEIVLDREIEN
jgi:hypothetical protein